MIGVFPPSSAMSPITLKSQCYSILLFELPSCSIWSSTALSLRELLNSWKDISAWNASGWHPCKSRLDSVSSHSLQPFAKPEKSSCMLDSRAVDYNWMILCWN